MTASIVPSCCGAGTVMGRNNNVGSIKGSGEADREQNASAVITTGGYKSMWLPLSAAPPMTATPAAVSMRRSEMDCAPASNLLEISACFFSSSVGGNLNGTLDAILVDFSCWW